ncbi:hypothetical protein BSKO_01834 [Bryopsis sp. KO-2023]|nr:hypothetical protein BSKO_01834 [Bryopsis sp. KO-2023]
MPADTSDKRRNASKDRARRGDVARRESAHPDHFGKSVVVPRVSICEQAKKISVQSDPGGNGDVFGGGSGESQELREIRSKGFHESCVTLARDKTIVKVNDAVVEAISQSASTVSDGGDGQAQAEVAATAIGKAVAKALAGAGVDLEVIGQGSAKGIASTQAPAIAKATAKAVAKAIAEVTQGFCRSRNDRRKSWEVVPEASGEISSEVKDESTASVDSRSEATGEGRAEGSAIGDATAKQVVPGQPSEAKPTETKPVTD